MTHFQNQRDTGAPQAQVDALAAPLDRIAAALEGILAIVRASAPAAAAIVDQAPGAAASAFEEAELNK